MEEFIFHSTLLKSMITNLKIIRSAFPRHSLPPLAQFLLCSSGFGFWFFSSISVFSRRKTPLPQILVTALQARIAQCSSPKRFCSWYRHSWNKGNNWNFTMCFPGIWQISWPGLIPSALLLPFKQTRV